MSKFVVNGLDLGELGIGDVVGPIGDPDLIPLEAVLEDFARKMLGSITFGPVVMCDLVDPGDEVWCPRGDEDRPFSD